jgi:hypothetical protein
MVFAAITRAQHVSMNTNDNSQAELQHSKMVNMFHHLKPNEVKCRNTPTVTIQGTDTVIEICTVRLKPRTKGFPVMRVKSVCKTMQPNEIFYPFHISISKQIQYMQILFSAFRFHLPAAFCLTVVKIKFLINNKEHNYVTVI